MGIYGLYSPRIPREHNFHTMGTLLGVHPSLSLELNGCLSTHWKQPIWITWVQKFPCQPTTGGRFGSRKICVRCYVRPLFKWPKINGISLLFGVVIAFITGFWAHLVGKTWVGLLLRVCVFSTKIPMNKPPNTERIHWNVRKSQGKWWYPLGMEGRGPLFKPPFWSPLRGDMGPNVIPIAPLDWKIYR